MDSTNLPQHPVYKSSTPEDADACAWAFITKDKFEKFYYKFEDMKPNHVRSRVLYSSLCLTDIKAGRDLWGEALHPLCPGHEVIAEVLEVGSEVTKFKKGDIVGHGYVRDCCKSCEVCEAGATNICPNISGDEKILFGKYFGGYSTHIQQPDTCIIKIPDGMDLKNSPPLLCAGITLYAPLAKFVKPGMTVGVVGIGGLGHLGIQYAAKMGAKVYGFTSTDSKTKFIKELGAEDSLIWTEKDYSKKYQNKFDVIINTIPKAVSREDFAAFCECIKPLGTFIQVGLPAAKYSMELGYFDFILKNITVYGSLIGSNSEMQEMINFSNEHNIKCVNEHYSWEEFPKALEKLENGKPLFRGVIDVDSESKKYLK